ncbi:acyl- carrier protein [Moesziomyces antarcticus]|uniref:Acyl carrier protein n=1 Tax=Pseudozyma antarctica TaxID=84753 RepID=A0A5C3FDN6_PSEA2|nr:acyl- carrier protein [Moesziomyces antarcticus]GAK61862.1 acyl- carrier protein [Moesziomyces antarcticus]SPO42380.1 probable ACP1 - mitochondrial acyl-carrier protein [Moesziomyces antarcticus]
MVAALRTAAASLVRARAPLALARAAPVARAAAVAPRFTPVRFYAASAGLSKSDIESRIVDVLKTFEKVDPSKVATTASFTTDLGLDSLDAVEVVMAIEEEFSIEIPDEEADNITTVQQAIDYIAKSPEAN